MFLTSKYFGPRMKLQSTALANRQALLPTLWRTIQEPYTISWSQESYIVQYDILTSNQ